MSNLIPEQITRTALAAILFDMADRILAGDSWAGNLEYLAPIDPHAPPDSFDVRGAYRIGNQMDQRGMRLIGRVAASSPATMG